MHDTILDRRQKTSFSDRYLDQIDYESLRRWLSQPAYRITGVDYEVLEERLAHGSFSPAEYKWAIDLAKSQLFLAQW